MERILCMWRRLSIRSKGRRILTINGEEHLLEKDSAFLVPPDVEHPARVVGDETWIAL